MTTAHRPTWKAAVGRAQEGGWSAGGLLSTGKSVLDEPSHTKLKLRASVSTEKEEVLRQSLAKLEQVEQKAHVRRMIGKRHLDDNVEKQGQLKLLKHSDDQDIDEKQIIAKYDDADSHGENDNNNDGWSDLDNPNDDSDLDDDDDSSSDDDDSEDEDEEAALQAELAKIRAEREAEKAKEEAEQSAAEQKQMEEAALLGNPLLNKDASTTALIGRTKTRWNEDIVFRNQAKSEPDRNKKRFINDTVRNDFHKRFLNKFVR